MSCRIGLYGLAAGLTLLLHRVWCASLPLSELERMLMDDESLFTGLSGAGYSSTDTALPYSTSRPSSTLNHAHSYAPIDIEGSWSDVFLRHNTFDPSMGTSGIQTNSLGSRHVSRPSVEEHEEEDIESRLGTEILHHSVDEHRQKLRELQYYLYIQTGAHTSPSEALIWLFEGRVSIPLFRTYIRTLGDVPAKFGMWPVKLGHDQLLLHQVNPEKHDFQLVRRFTADADHYRYLGVWQEIGRQGTRRAFRYLGVIQVPGRHRLVRYKNAYMVPNALRLSDIRVLSGSIFVADLDKL